ncbi:MAG: lipocalin-like domain-containing protein, partial [Alphaproteobacteria bacterium]|nr:lipocalin-like domain-containing protein [Alphaproteobacteria bacterium]
AGQNLVGIWKLVSIAAEDAETGQRTQFWGEHPNGRLILTASGEMMALLTGEGRKAPHSEAERGAAFGSMVAYSGRYRVEGDRFVTTVDMAWNESWVGTEQVRHYRIEGNTLHIETEPQPAAGFGNRVTRYVLVWDREH